MFFKICGIKEINTIDCCLKNNVNFFGMIFYSTSPRNISLDKAEELISYSKNKKIMPVGVFVNENIKKIQSVIKSLELQAIQLHGEESDKYIKEIKNYKNVIIIKSIKIKEKEDLRKIDYYNLNEYFLFDYKPNIGELPGGNSKTFDWSILSGLKIDKPWFLSGGVNISNIDNIKYYANPDGIDLSSGVEEFPGLKNNTMINDLFKKYHVKQ